MATVSIIKLKVRRGVDSDRKQIVLDNGEIGFVTDATSKRLFVGDGVTKGGSPAGMKFFYNGIIGSSTLATAQVGDLIYNQSTTSLFTLTGVDTDNFPDYSNPNAYKYVGPQSDETTITRNIAGKFALKTDSISATYINDNAYDLTTTGSLRRTPGKKLQVAYDSNKIVASSSGLTVNESSLNVQSFNIINKTFNCTEIYLTNLPSSPGPTGLLYRDPIDNTLRVSP